MRRILVIVLIVGLAGLAFGANPTIDDYKTAFQDFSDATAAVLPSLSLVGLNWSDAYIGQFIAVPPRFGVGLTAGAVTIPYSKFEKVGERLGIAIPSDFRDHFSRFGVPLPIYAADARIGGIVLPFDVGVKFGFLPEAAKERMTGNVRLDFVLAGFDVRVPIVQENLFLPDISIGGGLNYSRGSVVMVGAVPGFNVDLSPLGLTGPDATVAFPASDIAFTWGTAAVDFKLQASKSLLILEPHLGLGYTIGKSKMTSGIVSEGVTLTPAQQAALAAAGYQVTETGFKVESDLPWKHAVRAFGGLSINILLLRLDLGASYNFTAESLGATVGLRIQI